MPLKLSGLFSDPFAIATISFAVITWVVAIAGAAASTQSTFPRFTWWGLVYEALMIIIILLLYLYSIVELYKFTLVGLLSIAFVYTSNSTNNLIYRSDNSPNLCCAAGCMLLSMVNLIWIIYFGGHPESPTNQFVDGFALRNHSHNHLEPAGASNKVQHNLDDDNDFKNYNSPMHERGERFQDNNLRQSQLTTNNKASTPYMSSSQLNGLENFSSSDINNRDLTQNKRSTVYNDNEASQPVMNFRYKARALYSYDANPDDINEISFAKDEILEVDDIDGKWWQARRSNGQIGICPSNYVKLLD